MVVGASFPEPHGASNPSRSQTDVSDASESSNQSSLNLIFDGNLSTPACL